MHLVNGSFAFFLLVILLKLVSLFSPILLPRDIRPIKTLIHFIAFNILLLLWTHSEVFAVSAFCGHYSSVVCYRTPRALETIQSIQYHSPQSFPSRSRSFTFLGQRCGMLSYQEDCQHQVPFPTLTRTSINPKAFWTCIFNTFSTICAADFPPNCPLFSGRSILRH